MLYAVVDRAKDGEVVAVSMTRQGAKYIIAESDYALNHEHDPKRYKVRRAKGVLFDT